MLALFFSICSVTSDIELLKSSKQTKQVTVKTVRFHAFFKSDVLIIVFSLFSNYKTGPQCGIYRLPFESINREVMRKGPLPFRESFLVNVDSSC